MYVSSLPVCRYTHPIHTSRVSRVGAQAGVVSSGNSMDFVQQDLDNMQQHGAAIKEMEASGIAWSAHLFGTPFLALKSVTDIVDGGRVAQEEFMENLAAAAAALHVRLPVLLRVACLV